VRFLKERKKKSFQQRELVGSRRRASGERSRARKAGVLLPAGRRDQGGLEPYRRPTGQSLKK
jgi:hypothetical protein